MDLPESDSRKQQLIQYLGTLINALEDGPLGWLFKGRESAYLKALRKEKEHLEKSIVSTEAEIAEEHDKIAKLVKKIEGIEEVKQRRMTGAGKRVERLRERDSELWDRVFYKPASKIDEITRSEDSQALSNLLAIPTLGLNKLFSSKISPTEAERRKDKLREQYNRRSEPLDRKIEKAERKLTAKRSNIVADHEARKEPIRNDVLSRRAHVSWLQDLIDQFQRGLRMTDEAVNINEELERYAVRNNTTIDRIRRIGGSSVSALTSGQFKLADLESLAQWAEDNRGKNPDNERERLALKQFVNHTMIPHLDYFVIRALGNEKRKNISANEYPMLQQLSGYSYVLSAAQNATHFSVSDFEEEDAVKKRVEAGKKPLDLTFIRNSDLGDHNTRLAKAEERVHASFNAYRDMFKGAEKEIERVAEELAARKKQEAQTRKELKKARNKNEKLDDKVQVARMQLEASKGAYEAEDETRLLLSAGEAVIHATGKQLAKKVGKAIAKRIPFIGDIISIAEDVAGTPNGVIHDVNRMIAHKEAAEVEFKSKEQVIRFLQDRKVDVTPLEIAVIDLATKINQLGTDQKFQAELKDTTKQEAIAEAFIARYLIQFGRTMTEVTASIAKQEGFAKIDGVFNAFDKRSRVGEAFENLCFGIADSNDVAVLLAESNALDNPKKPEERVLKRVVESRLKSNTAELLAHASKVDLIYQANLTGLGTKLHADRQMVRSEQDTRVKALFSDAFGVDSDMHALTTLGAADVKQMFDFYLHRHGSDFMTDTKLRDGVVTAEQPDKKVNVLPDREIGKYVGLAKQARGYRQEIPDISDMFMRICGYEYFIPQSPNDAENPRYNIMKDNPEAPASYVMVNTVVQNFIERMQLDSIDKYRQKVGDKLDALIAQTFMDFFSEVGSQDAADPDLVGKRQVVKTAAKEGTRYGFVFDDYSDHITNSALGKYDVFLQIYARNLEKTLEVVPDKDRKALKRQIDEVRSTSAELAPVVVESGTVPALKRARNENHSHENTHWRGGR